MAVGVGCVSSRNKAPDASEPTATLLPIDSEDAVREHNAVRENVDPKAVKPLVDMKWSKLLQYEAELWAKGCPTDHREDEYGENIYRSTDKPTIFDAVDNWAGEACGYDIYSEDDDKCTKNAPACKSPIKTCGHYTQIVSDRVAEFNKAGPGRWLGCAMASGCKDETGFEYVVVCMYFPQGNFNKQPPYKPVPRSASVPR
jgi:hypothetical protein